MTYRTRALGCGCGCAGSGGCAGLGDNNTTPTTFGVAGEINGIATLAHDVQDLTTQLAARWGASTIAFDRGAYTALLSKGRRHQLTRLTSIDSRQLVTGVVGDVASVIITAKQLAARPVANEADRATNHAAQAALIGPARLMWDAMGEMYRYATVEQTSSTGGLGCVPCIIIAGAVVYLLIAVAAITALTYLVDSQMRLADARAEAQRVCRSRGGCTPDEYARLRRELALGPFDDAIGQAGEGVGTAVTVTLVAGGAVIAGIAAWGGWKIWKAGRALR